MNRWFGGGGQSLHNRIVAIYSLLFLFNVGAWLWAFTAFHEHLVLLGTAFLAYSLGLRHAVDADHIAAIDTVTRKLMQEGKRPVGTGLMFSLGHSTVVLVGAAAISEAAWTLESRIGVIRSVGGAVGTAISAFFLMMMAVINLSIFRSIRRAFVRLRDGEGPPNDASDVLLGGGGLLARIFRSAFRIVHCSRQMYLVGILFGLGFDTATEIGVLGIAASEAARGISFSAILIFPTLFAAGMSLVDTTDNILMIRVYGWAYEKPIRKLYYNMVVTGISAVVALVVGGVEALGLLSDHLHFRGGVWNSVARLNRNTHLIGYVIVGIFAASWLVSTAVYKWMNFDEGEPGRQMSAEGQ